MTLYDFLRLALLLLLGLFIYGQTFHFDFVFDDKAFIVANLNIRHLSDVHLIWQALPMTRLVGIYSFVLNYYLNQLQPAGYHIFNFIVHLAAVGLVWALAKLLFKITNSLPVESRLTKQLPFIVAVLFLVHPCQTQAVTYITQRFESMAAVFYLGTVYCYLSARLSTNKAQRVTLFGLAGLLSILGIMTKETVITVPLTIMAAEWILFPKRNNFKFYFLLALIGSLLYMLFSYLLRENLSVFTRSIPSASHDGDILTPMRYLLTQMRVFLTFLRILVLPIHQNLDYDYPMSVGFLQSPLTLGGAGGIAGIIFLIIKLRRSFPLIAFGLAWVVITFSINLAPRSNVIFEHKLYLISFGFFLVLVTAGSVLVQKRGIFLGILWCMIAVLTVLSFQRNKIWQNDSLLWQDTVRKSPDKARANNNYGVTLSNLPQALFYYNRAIERDPAFAEAYGNRGVFYEKYGNFTEAISDFTRAIELNPDFEKAYYDRGIVFAKQGKLPQAVIDYTKAIRLDPQDPSAYTDRGLAYAKQGRFAKAFADFIQVIKIDPKSEVAYNNLGIVYAFQGEFPLAVFNFDRAIAINPKYAESYWNRAIAYDHLRKYDMAWKDVRQVRGLGFAVNPQFIVILRKDSGRKE